MTNTTTRRFPLASIVLGSIDGTEAIEYRIEVLHLAAAIAQGDTVRARGDAWALTGQTFHPDRW